MTIQFQDYQAVNNDSQDKTLYGDLITHCKEWQHFADKSSKYTTAHETTHGINNDLRNASGNWEKKNGFYVGANRAIILDEPNFRKSDIIPFIPKELQSARFSLYIQGQQSWNDKPLYIYDEGVAYINGAWAAIELKETDNYVEDYWNISLPTIMGGKGPLDNRHYLRFPTFFESDGNTIVDGHIEFIPYMTAVLMTAHGIPTSLMRGGWHSVLGKGGLDQKLADFSRWLFRHACNAYNRQLKICLASYDVQDKLWRTMKSGDCYSSQRGFLKSVVGFEFPDGEIPEDDNSPIPWTI